MEPEPDPRLAGQHRVNAGDPIAARAAGEEGRDLADAIGDRPNSRLCRLSLAWAQLMEGDVIGAVAGFRAVIAECEADHDEFLKPVSRMGLGCCTGTPR